MGIAFDGVSLSNFGNDVGKNDVIFGVVTLRKKPYFPGPGISQKAKKDHVNIIFLSKFCLKKRPYFPSPKSSKQDLFSNQHISSFHHLFGSKKGRISHFRKN